MMDGRSPRIQLSLTIWTLLLIGLVLVEIRHLPPSLTVLLVPYLALLAWHWIIRLRERGQIEPAMSRDEADKSSPDEEPDESADSPGSGGRSGSDDCPMPASPRTTQEQGTPPSRRGRARRRSKAPEAEPSAAAWFQVRPGRFVRVEEMSPEHPADDPVNDRRPDEPHGASPSDEPGATLGAGSIPADADADSSESEVEARNADRDAAETVVPVDWEIGEEAIAGSLATTTYLIGCPSGEPEGRADSPST